MDRRDFLKSAGIAGLSYGVTGLFLHWAGTTRLEAADPSPDEIANPNWAQSSFKPQAKASSYFIDPPWGYQPANVFDPDMHIGWESNEQLSGAWLEVSFPSPHPVSELWILGQPIVRDVAGSDPYLDTYSRAAFYAPPRHVRCTLGDGSTVQAELRPIPIFQIIQFPKQHQTASIRIEVEDVWGKPGARETGIAKLEVFPHAHVTGFAVGVHAMYDVHDGKPEQAATLEIVNPGNEFAGARLTISSDHATLKEIPLQPIPAQSVSHQPIWIPAPYEDVVMEFKIEDGAAEFGSRQRLKVPAYRSYFDGGKFSIHCTCHNDLGWLNTQAKTADFRSEKIILPALKLLEQYPDFRYSMESTTYLMEFLERHPEKHDEMYQVMRQGRFAWGASYVQCLEVHVGPEKLARQFYCGRRWLRENFPGVDSQTYYKTDPPSLTLQMPQILRKAGIKYLIQGRMPFGFYHWAAPDGSTIFTYGLTATPLADPLDAKGHEGWLKYAEQREYYYAPRALPRDFIYDYWFDYFIPQPGLPGYVQEQNTATARFAESWNNHFASDPARQIHPPRMEFTCLEKFFDGFTREPLNITTLEGDWPLNWAYYDEPGHREGLLAGRLSHNRLLSAERICAALGVKDGFGDYPQKEFTDAWMTLCWPDHGFGGNLGLETDAVFVESYEKSLRMADRLLAKAGEKLTHRDLQSSPNRIPLIVFNPLTWTRSDVAQVQLTLPPDWKWFLLHDAEGKNVAFEIIPSDGKGGQQLVFVAEQVPSIGYRAYYLEPARTSGSASSLEGNVLENSFFKVTFGAGGIKSLLDKRLNWEALNTEKFCGGEVIQLTARGYAWDDPETVTTKDFDKTSNHPFPFKTLSRTTLRATAIREARFTHFTLRETVHLYERLPRVDVALEVVDWNGQPERELRVVFPINLRDPNITYEVPFGKVQLGEDELDFALLPEDVYRNFQQNPYGAERALPFREAINWIDASDDHYLGRGCLSASDLTVHLFRDETDRPVSYPLLQHVLLSTRKSQAWNPEHWFTQKGAHIYRMSLLPHENDWRARYREAIGFNYPLLVFPGAPAGTASAEQPASASFFELKPLNLVLTALKKSEDDNQVVVRFYEAEGHECEAQLRFSGRAVQARRANLIEDNEGSLPVDADGSLRLRVNPWEIVTVKVGF